MRDDYAAEARDEHVTKLDNVTYIIRGRQYQNQQISLCKFVTKLEVEKKLHNPYVSFDMVTFAIYSNNNGNMVQFPKRDISTARCKCTIYIFTY